MKNKRKIEIVGGSVKFPLIALKDFPNLYQRWHSGVEIGTGINTIKLEAEGAKLVKNGCADACAVMNFIDNVFTWGGKSSNIYIRPRFKKNSKAKVVKVMKEVSSFLQKKDIASAYVKITSLHGLGPSYGSKILRMLAPQQVGVYDSILKKKFDYDYNADDYIEFCSDCKGLADALNNRGIKHPMNKDGKWLPANAEAAIFDSVRPKKK